MKPSQRTSVGSTQTSANTVQVPAQPSAFRQLPALRELLVTILTNGEVARLSQPEILCTVRMLWQEDEGTEISATVAHLLGEWVGKGLVNFADDAHYSVVDPSLLRAELATA